MPTRLDVRIIQFVGTLEFNLMTIRAVIMSFNDDVPYSQTWGPGMSIGSALFPISSGVAWHPIAREKRHRIIHGRSALITICNLAGSVLFGVCAWGEALLPNGTNQSLFWSNAGTLVGAVFFLIVSIATLPRGTEKATP